MKNYCLTALFGLLLTGSIWSQGDNSISNNAAQIFNTGSTAHASDFGATGFFTNPKRLLEGSVYLFKSWENQAIITTHDGQRFLLRNVNLNVKRNTFESKINKDSIFTFSFNNIDKFTIDNKAYRNYYLEDAARICELVYESERLTLLKAHQIVVREGSPNPMLNRSADKYLLKTTYFIRQGERISPIKLTKRRVLKLFDKEVASKIAKYASSKGLSYKKPADIKQILSYASQW
ncbi:MAG: hypothetical protein QGH06_02470 [Lutibacter sp.]|jgi:hypothetical protein|nr:hypothetical protein [Lutibacter sp.]